MLFICRQLFLGHVVGFRPMKMKEKIHQLISIIVFITCNLHHIWESGILCPGFCKQLMLLSKNFGIPLLNLK